MGSKQYALAVMAAVLLGKLGARAFGNSMLHV